MFSIGDKVRVLHSGRGFSDNLGPRDVPPEGTEWEVTLVHQKLNYIMVHYTGSYWFSPSRFEKVEETKKVHYRLSLDLHSV